MLQVDLLAADVVKVADLRRREECQLLAPTYLLKDKKAEERRRKGGEKEEGRNGGKGFGKNFRLG